MRLRTFVGLGVSSRMILCLITRSKRHLWILVHKWRLWTPEHYWYFLNDCTASRSRYNWQNNIILVLYILTKYLNVFANVLYVNQYVVFLILWNFTLTNNRLSLQTSWSCLVGWNFLELPAPDLIKILMKYLMITIMCLNVLNIFMILLGLSQASRNSLFCNQ